jgi:hypothetical protein
MPLLLQNLRDTNRRLSFWLDGMITGTGRQAVVVPDHMAGLLSELLRAGATFRAEPVSAKANDPELEAELETYRDNVERLREVLPSIHGQLLAERARIEAQRARVKSAAEWARASRQIL